MTRVFRISRNLVDRSRKFLTLPACLSLSCVRFFISSFFLSLVRLVLRRSQLRFAAAAPASPRPRLARAAAKCRRRRRSSTKNFSMECNGARSGRFAAAARWRSKAFPANRTPTISARVAGGVWKTTDGGANWTPLFDKEDISSIGAIAVAPSDHNVIYVGTGEAAIRGNTTYGTGVYKSIDAGKTWKNVGLKDTQQHRRGHCRSAESRTSCWSRRSATPSVQTKSAEFFARPTAARPGRMFCSKTKTPAASTSCSIRTIRTSCSPRCGRRDGSRGFSPAAGRAADFIDRKITA